MSSNLRDIAVTAALRPAFGDLIAQSWWPASRVGCIWYSTIISRIADPVLVLDKQMLMLDMSEQDHGWGAWYAGTVDEALPFGRIRTA